MAKTRAMRMKMVGKEEVEGNVDRREIRKGGRRD